MGWEKEVSLIMAIFNERCVSLCHIFVLFRLILVDVVVCRRGVSSVRHSRLAMLPMLPY